MKKLSTQQQRNLNIEIGFLERLVDRDPGYVDALRLLGDDYSERGDLLLSVKVDERICILRPADATAHYNLACSLSLIAQVDLALESLDRACVLGFRDHKTLANDPDLDNVRCHPHFKVLQAKLTASRILVRDLSALKWWESRSRDSD